MAAYEVVLDRDYVGIRQPVARPRAAAAPARERPAAVFRAVSPAARFARACRRAYLSAFSLMLLALVGVLLLGPGAQPVAAALAIFAGSGALTAFTVAAALQDGIRSP